jgi:hypothetical protein
MNYYVMRGRKKRKMRKRKRKMKKGNLRENVFASILVSVH